MRSQSPATQQDVVFYPTWDLPASPKDRPGKTENGEANERLAQHTVMQLTTTRIIAGALPEQHSSGAFTLNECTSWNPGCNITRPVAATTIQHARGTPPRHNFRHEAVISHLITGFRRARGPGRPLLSGPGTHTTPPSDKSKAGKGRVSVDMK